MFNELISTVFPVTSAKAEHSLSKAVSMLKDAAEEHEAMAEEAHTLMEGYRDRRDFHERECDRLRDLLNRINPEG